MKFEHLTPPSAIIEFDNDNIKQLFGYEDAESEPLDRLKRYFYRNDTYKKVVSDHPIIILVGNKGVGKSAMFKISISEEKSKGNLPILIKPDDIAELGEGDENFLLKIRQWKYGLIKIIGSKVFREFGINEDKPGALSSSVNSLKENQNLLPSQQLLIDNFLKNKKIVVYIDDLDRGWEGKRSDINRLSALLNSVRDLSNENPGLCFKISLRTDVYFSIRNTDESSDKIEGSVIWYSWTEHEILSMLSKRILTFMGIPVAEDDLKNMPLEDLARYLDHIFEATFLGYGKWENQPMYKVLLSLIRKRPRDIVKLCTLAAREAQRTGSGQICTSHFINIFEEYSHGRMQDTVNEFRTELPEIERLIYSLRPNKKDASQCDPFVFHTGELTVKIGEIMKYGGFEYACGRKATPIDLAHFLFKISFVTATKIMENGDVERKYFEDNRYFLHSAINAGYDWEVHPVYRWSLQPDNADDIYNRIKVTI